MTAVVVLLVLGVCSLVFVAMNLIFESNSKFVGGVLLGLATTMGIAPMIPIVDTKSEVLVLVTMVMLILFVVASVWSLVDGKKQSGNL